MTRIRRSVRVLSPRERVWAALTVPCELDRWMTEHAALDLRPGGAYRFDYGGGIVSTGAVLQVEAPARLVLADDVGHGDAAVAITLDETPGGTRVTVVDTSEGEGIEWQWFREGVDRWWRDFLANLQSVLECGLDLRPTALWPTATLGIRYVSAGGGGVTVIETLPGSPAAAAGVRPGDRITAIGPYPVTGHHDVSDALLRCAPGQEVVVTAVRGGGPLTMAATLGRLAAATAA